MITTEDALAIAALADNIDAPVTLSANWQLEPGPQGTSLDPYSLHGLTYELYINNTTKKIAITFGDNINSVVGNAAAQYAVGALADATLQSGLGPGTVGFMADAGKLALSVFAATQPGYTDPPLGTQWGNTLAGYSVVVVGAGRGGAAAEYAMEQVLAQYPVAQTSDLISGVSFGGPGLSNAASYQNGVDFTSYVLVPTAAGIILWPDLFAESPLVPNHVGKTVQLPATIQNFITDVVVPGLKTFVPEGKAVVKIATTVAEKVAEKYIVGETVVNYANALVQNGIIKSNPISSVTPSSSIFNFDLRDIFPNIQNYIQNLNPSAGVIEVQSGATTTDGVTETTTLTTMADGSTTFVVSEDPAAVQATETTDFDPSGKVIQNQIEVSGVNINLLGPESAALARSTDGSLIVIFSPTITALGDFELVANPDDTTALVGVNATTGVAQEVAEFAAGGLSEDTITVSENTAGTIDVAIDIEAGVATNVSFDHDIPNSRTDYNFTGTDEVLRIVDIGTFTGTISDFSGGDTIDLPGISATGVMLGDRNVLNVQQGTNASVSLQFNKAQSLTGISFDLTPDGTGGTQVSTSSLVGLAGGSALSLIHPTTGTTTALGPSNSELQFYAIGNEAAMGGNLYVVTPDGLLTVSIETGLITNTATATPGGFVADNGTNQLVGIYSNRPSTLNPITGAISPIGAAISGLSGIVLGSLAAVNGTMYFVGQSSQGALQLYTVDLKTGDVIQTAPATSGIYVADNLTGDLLKIGSNGISLVNPATGALTLLGDGFSSPGGVPLGVAAAADGRVYFEGLDASSQRTLYTMDIATGALLSAAPTTATNIVDNVICFLRGTLIRTPGGEMPIERLLPGDEVTTAAGCKRRIVWIGEGQVLATRGRRNAATPVIIQKGALADNVPHRDLHVTKAHALSIDGVLIPAEYLVNHRSIIWDDHAQEVQLYHIELETHDVLVANGAPAESYRDDGNRWLFQNANSGWHLPPQEPCAPVLTGGPVVDSVWRRLIDRAGSRPSLPLTDEPDLCLVVDGMRLDAATQANDFYIFNLPHAPSDVRLVSRSASPQELGLARDPRCLGVAIRRIVVRQNNRFKKFAMTDEFLDEGSHPFEAGEGLRWTDGNAVLPASMFASFSGPMELLVHVCSTTQYIDDGETALRVA